VAGNAEAPDDPSDHHGGLRALRLPRSRKTRVAGAILLGAVGASLALALVPAVERDVGPATISARPTVGPGRTVLEVPPLGTVSADTHSSPLAVGLAIEQIDIQALGPAVSDARRRVLLADEVERDLRDMAVWTSIRLLIAGAVIGAVILALLPGRRRRFVAAGVLGGVLGVGALVGLTAITFDVNAFREPKFTGTLTRAPVVIEAVRQGEVTISAVRSRFEVAADRISELLTLVAEPAGNPRQNSIAILHVSDIHSNPIGVEIAAQLVQEFDVDAVLDTGDLTNFGLPVESSIGTLIERFDVPYYLVPGNHDSTANEKALDVVRNIRVIGNEVVDILGIEVLGWRDPTDTNWNQIPVEEANQQRVEEGEAVAEAVAEETPDVLAVHDRRMALASLGRVPLVLAGHDHKRVREVVDETRVLAVGSTGATGIDHFTVEEDRPYEAEIVYFRSGRAIAVDYVSFEGLGEDFEIERDVLEQVEEAGEARRN
jgi:predicted phosphodiesterase